MISNVLEDRLETDAVAMAAVMRGDQEIVVFGAGNLGRKIIAFLIRRGKTPALIVDNDQRKWGSRLLGVNIRRPGEALESLKEEACWVVAIWSPGHSFVQTRGELQLAGVKRVLHAAALMQLFPEDLLPHYHFQSREFFRRNQGKLSEVFNLLSDEESKRQFSAQVDYRYNLRFDSLPEPDPVNQYFPEEIVQLTSDEVFLDAGAYIGDTLEQFSRRTGGKFKKYLALEPDPENYRRLLTTVSAFPEGKVEAFPFAVGDKNEVLRFNATGGEGAGLDKEGVVSVDCRRIDDVFCRYSPSYLKFDIEGAELSALKGAERTIKTFHPKLAVCLYHRAEDLWTIPLLIKQFHPNYNLFVRTHSSDGFEFVLYAIPER